MKDLEGKKHITTRAVKELHTSFEKSKFDWLNKSLEPTSKQIQKISDGTLFIPITSRNTNHHNENITSEIMEPWGIFKTDKIVGLIIGLGLQMIYEGGENPVLTEYLKHKLKEYHEDYEDTLQITIYKKVTNQVIIRVGNTQNKNTVHIYVQLLLNISKQYITSHITLSTPNVENKILRYCMLSYVFKTGANINRCLKFGGTPLYEYVVYIQDLLDAYYANNMKYFEASFFKNKSFEHFKIGTCRDTNNNDLKLYKETKFGGKPKPKPKKSKPKTSTPKKSTQKPKTSTPKRKSRIVSAG